MPRQLTEGWLLAYKKYTEQSEAPEPFHLWTGMSILSGVLRRNVHLDQGYYTVYPNLYVVLVAPPGACKKSVALNIGLGLLRKVPGINIESNKMTPQSIIHTLSGHTATNATPKSTAQKTKGLLTEEEKKAEQQAQLKAAMASINLKQECTTTLASTEFSVMLGVDAHQNGLLALLTDLYDCPTYWSYKTINRGTEELHNVFLNIIAASTPDWLGSSIPGDAIGGGFTSRILFVAQNKKRKNNPRPHLSDEEKHLAKVLIEDLTHISKLKGEMLLTDDAEKFFSEWYNTRPMQHMDERFWGYLERKPDHLLKIATILSVSFSDDLIITQEHLEMGLVLLERLEARMPDAFRGIGGAGAKNIERVIDQIVAVGGTIEFRELARKNYRYLNSQELAIVIQTMAEAGMVIDRIAGQRRTIELTAFAPTTKEEKKA